MESLHFRFITIPLSDSLPHSQQTCFRVGDREAAGGVFVGGNLCWGGWGRHLGCLWRGNEKHSNPVVPVQQSQEAAQAGGLCGQQIPSCTPLTFYLWFLRAQEPSLWDGPCSPKHLPPGSLSWCYANLGGPWVCQSLHSRSLFNLQSPEVGKKRTAVASEGRPTSSKCTV